MSNLKEGRWTPEEIAVLLLIPRDSKKSTALIAKAANKLKRPYANTWAAWNSAHKKAANTSTMATQSKPGKPLMMDLKFEPDYEGKKLSIDADEITALHNTLNVFVPKLEPFKGAVTIPTRMEKIAREYLDTNYNSHKYAFSAITGTSKNKRLIRKF